MKKLFKYMIPCVTMALSLTSCSDTMDDKADIDAKYEKLELPAIAVASAVADSYMAGTAEGTLSDVENAQEVGFQVSTDETFATYVTFISDEVATEFEVELSDLEEKTTYYVRPYVFTKTGQTICGTATSFTTPGAPIFDIIGSYTALDYGHTSPTEYEVAGTPYTVTISYVAGSTTEVEIYNLWDGGETLIGLYDAASSTITVPTGQNLYYYEGYGYVLANALNDAMTDEQDDIILTFTPLGGLLESSIYDAYLPPVDYSFGYVHTSMRHDMDEPE